MYNEVVDFIRGLYGSEAFIPLHEPRFWGNERIYVAETIDSTYVSSVGKFVDKFENMVAEYVGAKYAIATVNGTAALHVALKLVGVEDGDEVISQPLTFVATCNAIRYCNASPVFIDVDRDSMGLSPVALEEWLHANVELRDDKCYNKTTGKIIRACVPMHVFGHPVRIVELKIICDKYNIALVEDAAESLGSLVGDKHTGTFGKVGVFSFNGNKIITTGGGGMIVTDDEELAKRAKHITTTAKIPHPYEFTHDEIGYNYRMPNLNAALGCAQLEQMNKYLNSKRIIAMQYKEFFENRDEVYVDEPQNAKSNFWLNAIIMKNKKSRDDFLQEVNFQNIMVRPIWTLMNNLPMFESCQSGALRNAELLEGRVVNLPSSVMGSV